MPDQDALHPQDAQDAPNTLELHISDLRDGQRGGQRHPIASASGAAARPSRRRIVGALLVTSILLTIIAGIVFSIPHTWDGLRASLFPAPTTAPALTVGADTIILVNDVPWGSLLLDGRLIHIASTGDRNATLTLARGPHHLLYAATPFPPLTCQFSVPAHPHDTCPFLPTLGYHNAGRVLDLRATPDRLPPAQFAALSAAVTAALQRAAHTTTLLANERYRTAAGVAVAAHPLDATLTYQLNQDPARTISSISIFGQQSVACVTLCTADTTNSVIASELGPVWSLAAVVSLAWTYATTDGHPISANAPAAPTALPTLTYLPIGATWRSGWLVTTTPIAPSHAPQCAIAVNYLFSLRLALQSSPTGAYLAIPASPAFFADGCLIAGGQAGASGRFASQPGYFLYRFGVLVAANAQASQAIPDLPIATPDEVQFAQQLAKQLLI